MKVCSHQPSLFPWVGYWNKVAHAGHLIHLTGVQYAHQDYQNRVKVQGRWMALPVDHSKKFGALKAVEIVFPDEVFRQLEKRLYYNLMGKRKPFAHRLDGVFEYVLTCKDRHENSLIRFNMTTFNLLAEAMELKVSTVEDSQIPNPEANKTQRLKDSVLRSCPNIANLVYFAGEGTISYLDPTKESMFPLHIVKQRFLRSPSSDSILEALVTVRDIKDYVMTAATWEAWNA